MNDEARFIRENVMAHNKWFEECIPMIASENLMSPLAKEMLISDWRSLIKQGLWVPFNLFLIQKTGDPIP